ncbi:MAG: DUF2326 domain-containing protein [Coriobacteriales bacterium]|nr:DUF2326 domain-containing protein [Coriobacteriales bacterium]
MRLYTNKDDVFKPIWFKPGLNVVLGEIRHPENLDKDTHNLGKSTLCRLIDFCLLKDRDKSMFLFRHRERFEDLDFFLQIETANNGLVTVRRSVRTPKVDIHRHDEKDLDARELRQEQWSHPRMDFKRAKDLLDGLLALDDLSPWSYRKVLPYLLRAQSDYTDVFEPQPFREGRDVYWKPFALRILGYDQRPFEQYYEAEAVFAAKQREVAEYASRLPEGMVNLALIEAMIDARRSDADAMQQKLDQFSFNFQDCEIIEELTEDEGIDERIALLNQRRYALRTDITKIKESLNREQILYDDGEAERLFAEVGIHFEGQVRKDFRQLVDFNKAITAERRKYLAKDLEATQRKLDEVNEQLEELDLQRSRRLRQLEIANAMEKYKEQSDNLIELKASIGVLETQRDNAERLEEARRELAAIKANKARLSEEMIDAANQAIARDSGSLFLDLRKRFADIVRIVLDKHGFLTVTINKENHAEFRVEIQNRNHIATNEDQGDTYRKLLCIAFDLALLGAHEGHAFPLFVYHDDVFSTLDRRKQVRLLQVMREYAQEGVQQIVTAIDSTLPELGSEEFIRQDEIILTLHDDGESGLLFKMPAW